MKRAVGGAAFFILLWGLFAFGIHTATQGNTLGSDFFIFWNAGRAAVFERQNPYSDALSLQAQMLVFKRPAAAGEDQLGFAYPPYAFLAILPLLFLPFDWAQAVWLALLILLWVAVGGLTFRSKRWVAASFLLFYPMVFGVVLGNFAVLISAGLLLLFGMILHQPALPRGVQVSLGLLAAWLTIKPQFVWLFVIFLVVYAVRRRQRWLLGSLLAGVAGFMLVSFWLVPGWLPEWLAAVSRYAAYNQTVPVVQFLMGEVLAADAAVVGSVLILAVLGAITLRLFWLWWHGHLALIPLWAWLGMVIFLAHPHGKSYEHLAFLMPLVVWAASQADWRGWTVNLFWWGSLAVSWAAFIISKTAGMPVSAAEWPILFHLVWVGWMLISKSPPRILQS